MRMVLGTLAGLITAIVAITAIETIGHLLFPPPPGADLRDPSQVARVMDTIPLAAKLWVVLAWFAGSFAGAWAALTLSRWRIAPWIVAAFVIAGAVYSYVQIPHPLWMQAAGVLLPMLAAWLALQSRGRAISA